MYRAENIFTRLLLPFAIGIFVAWHFQTHISVWIIAPVFVLFLLTGKIIQRNPVWLFHFKWISGLFIHIILFLSGIQFTQSFIDVNRKNHFSHHLAEADYALLQIEAPPEDKGEKLRILTSVSATGKDSNISPCTGNVLLYLKKDSSSASLRYGDCILVKNKFRTVSLPVNPGQFNLKKYLALKNIYYTISPKPDEWKFTGINQGNPFFKKTYQLRDVCLSVIERSIEPQREKSVLSALILGNRDHLDYDTVQSYTSAGVIHILAVSGLHVGLIYVLLNSIFNLFDKMNKWRIIRVPVMIFIIWGVAVITGSSGSVVRAAMMITLIIIGKNLRWHIHTVNIVAASAFIILLLYGPLILFDVGFQLSVFAILGISLLAKPIFGRIEVNNRMLSGAWRITSASLAATIGAVPLTLFYFHQFPLYFMLANIIAIPLSTLTIYCGLLMLIVSFVPYINIFMSKTVTVLLQSLDIFISHIEMLPHSVIKLSYFPFTCLLLIILVIVTLYLYAQSRRRINLYVSAGAVTLIVLIISFHAINLNMQKSFTVFSFPGKTVFQATVNRYSVLFADNDVLENDWNQRYFQQLRQSRKIKEGNALDIKLLDENTTMNFNNRMFFSQRFMQIDDKRIAILNELPAIIPEEKMIIDYLILEGNPELDIKDLLHYFSFKQLIFASSNYRKKTEKWMNEAKSLGIMCHTVTGQGAFEITW